MHLGMSRKFSQSLKTKLTYDSSIELFYTYPKDSVNILFHKYTCTYLFIVTRECNHDWQNSWCWFLAPCCVLWSHCFLLHVHCLKQTLWLFQACSEFCLWLFRCHVYKWCLWSQARRDQDGRHRPKCTLGSCSICIYRYSQITIHYLDTMFVLSLSPSKLKSSWTFINNVSQTYEGIHSFWISSPHLNRIKFMAKISIW